MKNKILQTILMIICSTCIFFVSCKDKETKQDEDVNKILEKGREIYETEELSEYVKFVQKHFYTPFKKGESMATPLLLAAQEKNIDAIDIFIEKGASPYENDNKGLNLVDYVLMGDDVDESIYSIDLSDLEEISNYDFLEYYIFNKFPKDIWLNKNLNGDLVLTTLISRGARYSLLEKIIKTIPNTNYSTKDGKTLLMYAAQNNTDDKVIKLLLDNSANIYTKNKNEWSAAMYAARWNPNPFVLESLLMRGARIEPNSVGLTLIMLASCNENPGVLYSLLNYCSDINAVTNEGKTALMYACENRMGSSTLNLLINNGADVNLKDNSGKTALMYAIENYNSVEEINILLDHYANLYDVDANNKSIKDYLNTSSNIVKSTFSKQIDELFEKQHELDSTKLEIPNTNKAEHKNSEEVAEENTVQKSNEDNA